jgi:3-oxoacyl-[acyl-carrier protein] reductase
MNSYIEACFVTGAGKGIGRAVVDLALQKKQFIIALVKNKRDLKSDKKKKLKVFYGDVTKPKHIDKIFTYCLKNQIYIKYLINNAGQRQRKPFLKINKSDLLKIFQVNFFSVFFIIQKYILYLNKIKKKGSVVNVGSIVGQLGFNCLTGYGSTKSAINGLTKSLTAEFTKEKLRFNVVNPGFTKSSFYKKFKTKDKKLYNWTLSRIPNKKWAEPIEIAKLIHFLCSDESSYINGESISIDGGWTNT